MLFRSYPVYTSATAWFEDKGRTLRACGHPSWIRPDCLAGCNCTFMSLALYYTYIHVSFLYASNESCTYWIAIPINEKVCFRHLRPRLLVCLATVYSGGIFVWLVTGMVTKYHFTKLITNSWTAVWPTHTTHYRWAWNIQQQLRK